MNRREPDMDKASRGLVPWTVEGYFEVYDYAVKVKQTPRDDWDLRRRAVSIEVAPGDELSVEFNNMAWENQIGYFVNRRYDDATTAAAHLWRYFEIGYVLDRHKKRFIAERLLREADDDPVLGRGQEVNEVLIRALCELPFSRRRGKGRRTFDIEAVVRRAVDLRREEEAQGGGA